jgi:hypothetical protein
MHSGDPAPAGHPHWHYGANYPNEPSLGLIACVASAPAAIELPDPRHYG